MSSCPSPVRPYTPDVPGPEFPGPPAAAGAALISTKVQPRKSLTLIGFGARVTVALCLPRAVASAADGMLHNYAPVRVQAQVIQFPVVDMAQLTKTQALPCLWHENEEMRNENTLQVRSIPSSVQQCLQSALHCRLL